jgi:hypothetical protein
MAFGKTVIALAKLEVTCCLDHVEPRTVETALRRALKSGKKHAAESPNDHSTPIDWRRDAHSPSIGFGNRSR